MKAENQFALDEALRLVEANTAEQLRLLCLGYWELGSQNLPHGLDDAVQAANEVSMVTRRTVKIPEHLSAVDKYLFVLAVTDRGYGLHLG